LEKCVTHAVIVVELRCVYLINGRRVKMNVKLVGGVGAHKTDESVLPDCKKKSVGRTVVLHI
jgi:hypothetical protein